MHIAILGTGQIAEGLATRWSRAGHEITIAGRTPAKAHALATRLAVRTATIQDAVADADAVLLAIAWDGVADALAAAGPLTGTVLIDPTNAVEEGIGVLRTPPGESAAQQIAALVPGAHVVKAFNLFTADQWLDPDSPSVTVAISGDDQRALDITATLVRDAGAEPAIVGGLDRARQLEETAGFVIALAFTGVQPRNAIPHIPMHVVTAQH
ncbi:MAG TPA: NAD(P)-binding domain-containing protein [Pseudonocardiaceae bacterium]|jgi:hypothetical protein